MAPLVFADKTAPPTETTLAEALGSSHRLWAEVAKYAADRHGSATTEWKFPGVKWGWSFRVKDAKRILIYMTPDDGFFRVAFAFGDKSVADAEGSALPEPIKDQLRNATRYPEGRGLRLEVRSRSDVTVVKKLVDIKLAR